MLTGETKAPFSNPDWIFEIKWDGYRAIAECKKSESRLYSRNAISFAEKYPAVYEAVQAIQTPVVLDGEIVVPDENGKPDFQLLQQFGNDHSLPIIYYVFDILSYKGKTMMNLPLLERKEQLKKVLPESDIIKYCDHIAEDGETFFKVMQEQDMEGMVAKRKTSLYHLGERSKDWLKIKHQLIDEVVIAGFTEPQGSRKYFGSLLLGQYQNGTFVYVGHSGTGFSSKSLQELHETMLPLVTRQNPFAGKVPRKTKITWVKPTLVANVRYTEMTRDGILRHPVFHGLRIDKTPADMKKSTKQTVTSPEEIKGEEKDTLQIGKIKLPLSHLNKLFWPEEGFTKGDLIMYYNSVCDYILPYLRNRPQSMRRSPNGIADAGFFQKDVGDSVPGWAKTISLHSESADKNIQYLLCNDRATLLYMANLGCIELNPWNSTVKKIDNPDYLVLDLDPSDKNSFDDVIDAALLIKDLLDAVGANNYCKTSGSTGLHIYVPLGARYSYEESRLFAEIVAHQAANKAPELATTERSIKNRNSKLYIDFLQNKRGQTLACPYSVRPKPGATVSAPLDWKEVKKGLRIDQFTIKNMAKRLEKKGDLFKPVLGSGVNLKKCLAKMEKV